MKPFKALLISGILISLSLETQPSHAEVKTTQVDALVESLRQAAPPQRPNDGMYSNWQVLPGIIPDWSKRCLGKTLTPEQFDNDNAAARQVVSCIVKRELNTQTQANVKDEQAVRRVACWWMTGKANECQRGATATYVNRVLDFYRRQLAS